MSTLFWVSTIVTVFAYVGYPLWMYVFSRLHQRPIAKKQLHPRVTIVMAVRNESANLDAKIENLRRLDYPRNLTQTIIVSNGSTDETANILRSYKDEVESVILEQSCGKAAALNEGVRRASGEILVFLDARQRIESNAISQLTACFGDMEVGAVSGELLLEAEENSASAALGIYWEIEKAVRKCESASGSGVGATGAIYAVRRELYEQIPRDTILDDVFVPMNVARRGRRVVFEPKAIAYDSIFTEKGKEFSRKVRTLTGNYQLLWLAPWLLSNKNPLLFRFVSHKLLRLCCPLLLLLMLITSGVSSDLFYRLAFYSQVAVYTLAACGALIPYTRKFKPVGIPSTFVMLNAAAALAFYNVVRGKHGVWA